MTLAGRAGALEILRATPRGVETSLHGTPRALLQWMPVPGGWSIVEVLAHCVDVEADVYLDAYARVAASAAETDPEVRVAPFDTEARALSRGGPDEAPQELFRAWKRTRREAMAKLDSLPEPAWCMSMTHTGTTLPLDEFVAQHAAHDRAHAKQIAGILERHAVLARLASMPGEIGTLLDGVSGPPERVRHEIARLGDFERRMLMAYARIVEQDRPELSWLVGAADQVSGPGPALAALRRDFEKLRAATHALLYANGARQWQRRGIDPRLGERTLADLVARHLDHDAQCLAALRAALTYSPAPSPPR
jgi:hypothetical protein